MARFLNDNYLPKVAESSLWAAYNPQEVVTELINPKLSKRQFLNFAVFFVYCYLIFDKQSMVGRFIPPFFMVYSSAIVLKDAPFQGGVILSAAVFFVLCGSFFETVATESCVGTQLLLRWGTHLYPHLCGTPRNRDHRFLLYWLCLFFVLCGSFFERYKLSKGSIV